MMKHLILLLCLTTFVLSFENLTNVALHKPAKQCDTYKFQVGGDASKAVDGNADKNYLNGYCSHTESEINSWWMVDFLGDYTVVAVNLTNRGDKSAYRLSDFTVYVSHSNPVKFTQFPTLIPGQQCFYRKQMISSDTSEFIECKRPIFGRYLVVFKPANKVLTICEIEVLASGAQETGYRMVQGAKISKDHFYSGHSVASGTECAVVCSRARGGIATAVQYRKTTKLCQCVQMSGFEIPQPEWTYDAEWDLFLAVNN